jgi:hypothetical protein
MRFATSNSRASLSVIGDALTEPDPRATPVLWRRSDRFESRSNSVSAAIPALRSSVRKQPPQSA